MVNMRPPQRTVSFKVTHYYTIIILYYYIKRRLLVDFAVQLSSPARVAETLRLRRYSPQSLGCLSRGVPEKKFLLIYQALRWYRI
jgi:hypothetical protein